MTATTSTLDFDRKISTKFMLRRWFGELYVGKRIKRHSLSRWLKYLTPVAGGRVLEVGSEDGSFTEWFDRAWPHVTVEGLELDPAHATACANWVHSARRTPKLSFRQGDLLALPNSPQYDLIFCLDVLGYIKDDLSAVRTLASALKVGGRLIVHQPNVDYRTFFGRVHHVTPELAGDVTSGHLRHGYTPEDLKLLLSEAGLLMEVLERWNGSFSDVAHRIYQALEFPTFLRFVALPILDALWFADVTLRWHLGNTVFAVARKPGMPETCVRAQ